MHTSGGAACSRDDDGGGAPELRVCRTFRNTKVMESRPHVNEMIHPSAMETLLPIVLEAMKRLERGIEKTTSMRRHCRRCCLHTPFSRPPRGRKERLRPTSSSGLR